MPDDALGLDSLNQVAIDSTSADSPSADKSTPRPETIGLSEPAGGVPPVIDDDPGLSVAVAALWAGTGPIAIDAERASGYRYGHRAFLIQVRRAQSGTYLIDPTGVRDFGPLSAAMRLDEWVLHSADQDLPCLADLGLAPRILFDTELAAKLLGKPRFGLGNLIEDELGLTLAKEHSAADWSRRPLPEPWLRYAALDVELLIELRD
ncbi:MAG: ribonuclease D, partial [Candidatus Nanopelagicales bacterium]|nr:ribonuclease D [Candidatus Nanopelagicales bacterium]